MQLPPLLTGSSWPRTSTSSKTSPAAPFRSTAVQCGRAARARAPPVPPGPGSPRSHVTGATLVVPDALLLHLLHLLGPGDDSVDDLLLLIRQLLALALPVRLATPCCPAGGDPAGTEETRFGHRSCMCTHECVQQPGSSAQALGTWGAIPATSEESCKHPPPSKSKLLFPF